MKSGEFWAGREELLQHLMRIARRAKMPVWEELLGEILHSDLLNRQLELLERPRQAAKDRKR